MNCSRTCFFGISDHPPLRRYPHKEGNARNVWRSRNLGVLYAKGEGVPQDDEQAAKWFRLAAEQGNGNAQFNLGLLHGEGQGVPQDVMQAHMWWNLAAAQGIEQARKARDMLAEGMTPPNSTKHNGSRGSGG